MDRSRFNNILYAIQVLANHDLTGQSQDEAMPYLRAINSCVQSLLEIHWNDMGGHLILPRQPEPHLVEEQEDDDASAQVIHDDNNIDISDTEEDAEDTEEEDDDAAEEEYAEYLAEAGYDADDMEVQYWCRRGLSREDYTIPEDQRWADHLHPNVSARRPLPLDDNDFESEQPPSRYPKTR